MTDTCAPISPTERIARLRLARTGGIGPITYRQLMARFANAAAALEAVPELARRAGGRAPRVASKSAADAELDRAAQAGATLVTLGEAAYPSAVAAIEDAPPVLTLLGRAELPARPTVAIVGARNASAGACRIAQDLARELGAAGFVVTSGFARGIDAAAHAGSLSTGTIAVFAGGADVIYPPEHAALHRSVAAQGLILSELPLGTEPHARHFPRRNRLISGLSSGVVVVEAALRSGSLSTARFALEQGREVMAVPGSPLDPRCRGSNHLLREGARLVEGIDDILTALGGSIALADPSPLQAEAPPPALAYPPEAALSGDLEPHLQVAERLGPTPVAVDELVRQCQMSPPVVRAALLDIELAGRLERHPGDRVSLLP
ncbi:MAG: DNA-processing protein DprA [Dongiaceae bacterium]